MGKRTLVWATEDGERWLAYRDRYTDGLEATETTLEQLADLCDRGAENSNAHEFVGSHRLLAALLFRRLGRETATGIMREIAELGGLDEMNGVCSDDDAFKELGVPQPWNDWSLD